MPDDRSSPAPAPVGRSGSTVLITGASAGIGRATARAFVARGARVALLARGKEGLDAAAREVAHAGGESATVQADVADPEQVEEAASRAEQQLGPIDVWVNNAMATVFAPFEEIEPGEMKRVTEVTYLGFVWGTRSALKRMKPRNHGTIVQVGSALAYRGIPLQSAYCAAKHAIKGFTESVRTELLHDGCDVRISMVQLPAHNTPQFETGRAKMHREPQPMPPIYQPEVAADAIVWAAENRPREIYAGLPVLKTVWGNRIAGSLVDRYLARNGYEDQLTDDRLAGERSGNLFEPVPGDHGARGRFDGSSRERSLHLQAGKRWRRLRRTATGTKGRKSGE